MLWVLSSGLSHPMVTGPEKIEDASFPRLFQSFGKAVTATRTKSEDLPMPFKWRVPAGLRVSTETFLFSYFMVRYEITYQRHSAYMCQQKSGIGTIAPITADSKRRMPIQEVLLMPSMTLSRQPMRGRTRRLPSRWRLYHLQSDSETATLQHPYCNVKKGRQLSRQTIKTQNTIQIDD